MEQTVVQTPGLLKLGGREFVILPPETRDAVATHARMTELARARCVSPLDYVLRHTHLPPALLAAAVAEAIKIGAGGGDREPTPETVNEQYTTTEGVRWRVWWHVSRVLKDFGPEDAAALVTDDNAFDTALLLDAALKFAALDPKKKEPAPPTGAGS